MAGTDFDLRTARKLAGIQLDHAFTGLRREADGLAWVRLSAAARPPAMWMDAGQPWLQVFTSDPLEEEHRRAAVAVEPMTCPPNAFASGEDLLVLAAEGIRHAAGGASGLFFRTYRSDSRTRARSSGGVDVVRAARVAALHERDKPGVGPQERARPGVPGRQLDHGRPVDPRAISTGLRGLPS